MDTAAGNVLLWMKTEGTYVTKMDTDAENILLWMKNVGIIVTKIWVQNSTVISTVPQSQRN